MWKREVRRRLSVISYKPIAEKNASQMFIVWITSSYLLVKTERGEDMWNTNHGTRNREPFFAKATKGRQGTVGENVEERIWKEEIYNVIKNTHAVQS